MFFQEIEYKNEVVGFITFDHFNIIENILSITETYIIPKFRGKNLLYKVLRDFIFDENHEYLIRKPNKSFLKVLYKNNLIFKIEDDLWLSYFKFHVEIEDMYTNKQIKRFYRKSYDDISYKANIFDYNLSVSLLRDPAANFVKKDDFFACTKPRKNDWKKYNLAGKLNEIDRDYLEVNYILWVVSADEIIDFLEKTESKLYDSVSVKKVLGTKNA